MCGGPPVHWWARWGLCLCRGYIPECDKEEYVHQLPGRAFPGSEWQVEVHGVRKGALLRWWERFGDAVPRGDLPGRHGEEQVRRVQGGDPPGSEWQVEVHGV